MWDNKRKPHLHSAYYTSSDSLKNKPPERCERGKVTPQVTKGRFMSKSVGFSTNLLLSRNLQSKYQESNWEIYFLRSNSVLCHHYHQHKHVHSPVTPKAIPTLVRPPMLLPLESHPRWLPQWLGSHSSPFCQQRTRITRKALQTSVIKQTEKISTLLDTIS